MKRDSLKQLLIAWRDHSLSAVNDLLDSLFEHAGDVLLEYAEKAESNQHQALFLEGRRELQENENRLKSLFSGALSREIFEFMQRPGNSPEVGAEAMSLVSKESQELSLALETICKQAMVRDRELYFALSQRLGVVSGGIAVRHEALPAGPHQLARILERVITHLRVERQVLLAIFTLFEKEVIRHSAVWHEDLNEGLREFGILPNIKYTFRNREGAARKEAEEPEAPKKTEVPKPEHEGKRPVSPDRSAAHVAQGETGTASNVPTIERALMASPGQVPAPPSDLALPKYQGPAGENASDTSCQSRPAIRRPQASPEGGRDDRTSGDQLLGRIRELLTARRARSAAADNLRLRPDPVAPASSAELVDVIGSQQLQAADPSPQTGVLETGVRRVRVSRFMLQKMRDVLQAQRDYIKKRIGQDRLSYLDEDTIDIVGMLFDAMLKDDYLSDTIKALLSHLHTPYLKLAVRDRDFLAHGGHPARLLLENMIEAGSRWVDEGDLTFGVFPALQHVVRATLELKDYSAELFEEFGDCLSAEARLFLERQEIREARTIETEKGQARLEEARRGAGQAAQTMLAGIGCPSRYQVFVNGPWTDYLTLLWLRCNGDPRNAVWQGALDLGQRLQKAVDEVTRGIPPKDAELGAVREEMEERLGDVIPNYGAEAKRLFDIFSADQEIEIVAPVPPETEMETQATMAPSPGQQRLQDHLRELPPGSWLVFHTKNKPDRVAKLSWLNKKTERFLFVDQTGSKAIVVPLNELVNKINRQQAHILPASGESYVESTLSQVLNNLKER